MRSVPPISSISAGDAGEREELQVLGIFPFGEAEDLGGAVLERSRPAMMRSTLRGAAARPPRSLCPACDPWLWVALCFGVAPIRAAKRSMKFCRKVRVLSSETLPSSSISPSLNGHRPPGRRAARPVGGADGVQVALRHRRADAAARRPDDGRHLALEGALAEGRVAQSMAFFSAAGMERLCSGVTKSTASAASTSPFMRTTAGVGFASSSWLKSGRSSMRTRVNSSLPAAELFERRRELLRAGHPRPTAVRGRRTCGRGRRTCVRGRRTSGMGRRTSGRGRR